MSSEDSDSDSLASIESRVRYIMEEVIPRDGDVDIMKIAEETVINASKAAKLHALTKTEAESNKDDIPGFCEIDASQVNSPTDEEQSTKGSQASDNSLPTEEHLEDESPVRPAEQPTEDGRVSSLMKSTNSCMTSADCLSMASAVTPMPKYNLSSRKRFELGHASHDSSCDMNSYLTPTQRKDQQIKELKSQVKVMGKQLEDKERDIESLKSQLGQEAAKAFDQRTEQIQKVRDETIALQLKNEQLANDYTESQKMIKQLQIDIEELKEDQKRREEDRERMYLEMYKKGQMSAQFEREEDLQALLTRGVNNVGIRELARRLAWTECELAKWQTIQRKEAYENADKPSTEAAATLRFLKDSFFHYLTNERDTDDHLRAMIRIFNYTEVQKKKVAKCLLEGKKLRK
ncbi:unnamed protein product [Acanthosepion pharaonis]|uniref:GRIP domain-containing protein n=1 Tax=Acanthosepion pharaonis TaxID=158019 RepID=A0A812BX91_ACAPH|nr:unnamed protein product [Sepia pharaonis]